MSDDCSCPFCGKPPIITDYYVGCEDCNIYFDFEDDESKQKAILKWKTRHNESHYIQRLQKTNSSLENIRSGLNSDNPEETLRIVKTELLSIQLGIKNTVK